MCVHACLCVKNGVLLKCCSVFESVRQLVCVVCVLQCQIPGSIYCWSCAVSGYSRLLEHVATYDSVLCMMTLLLLCFSDAIVFLVCSFCNTVQRVFEKWTDIVF